MRGEPVRLLPLLLLVLLGITVVQHLHLDPARWQLARWQSPQRLLRRPDRHSRVAARPQVPPLDHQFEVGVRLDGTDDTHRLARALHAVPVPAPSLGVTVYVGEVALAQGPPTRAFAVQKSPGHRRLRRRRRDSTNVQEQGCQNACRPSAPESHVAHATRRRVPCRLQMNPPRFQRSFS